jgi:hypothetical protein
MRENSNNALGLGICYTFTQDLKYDKRRWGPCSGRPVTKEHLEFGKYKQKKKKTRIIQNH